MAQTIKIKRSATSGNKLTGSNSIAGEIGMNTADKSLYIQTGSTDASVVTIYDDSILHLDDTNNRVGIGTTSPSKPLHVSGGAIVTGDLQVEGGDIEFNQSSGQARLRNLLQDTYMRFSVNVGGTQTNAINIRGNNAYVGIGSAEGGGSPVYPLDVYNAGVDTVGRFTSGDNRARILVADNDTNAYVIAEGSKMSLGLTSSLHASNLNIQSNGNVGIGTTSPAQKLDVSGVAKIRGTGDGTVVAALGQLSNDANTALFSIYADDDGATRPLGGDALEFNTSRWGSVFGQTRSSAAGANVRAWKFVTETNSDERGTSLYLYNQADGSATGSTTTTNPIYLSTLSNQNSYINTGGNFGIGTTSPSEKLTVDGNISVSGTITTSGNIVVNSNSALLAARRIAARDTNGLAIATSDGTERIGILNSGAVRFNNAFTFPTAIGSAGQVLKVPTSGTTLYWANEAAASVGTSLSDADGDTKIQVEETADEDRIRFDTAGTQRMVLNELGRLGINTGTPNYLLDIESTSSALLRIYNTGSNVLTSLIAQNDLGTAKFSTQSG